MSTGRKALAAAARLRISSSAASFMSEEYASRLRGAQGAISFQEAKRCLAKYAPHEGTHY